VSDRSLISSDVKRIDRSTVLPKVLVLVGPTASGKTELSLHLADILGGEIISADSRQVYKYLDIGTAKPSIVQRRLVKHYFVDEKLPDEEFSAGEFGEEGRGIIATMLARGVTPIVVGGSGLYVRSLVDGLFHGPGADKQFRNVMEQRLKRGETVLLLEELRAVDPVSAERIDPTKPRRIVRALEVYHLTGRPVTDLHRRQRVEIPYTSRLFGLMWERKTLYARIEQRCEAMIAAGLLKEVEELESRGYNGSMNALNTVGYAEAFAYRQGKLSYDQMMRLFKQNSRRYAKRQLTWFRADTRVRWIDMDKSTDPRSVAETIAKEFNSCSGG
jgi:tRNA dimethylallyltransferase